MTDASQPLFLFGPGYTAQALTQIWAGKAYGTVRSEKSRKTLEKTPIDAVSTADHAGLAAGLGGAHLIITAAPDDDGCPALRTLSGIADLPTSVTYLSTTGVYGDLSGGWAMEWTPTNPGSDRGRRRVDAEQGWIAARPDARIVRLPGIYGPGRSAFDRLDKGTARRIVKPNHVFSRAHVDDIASGLKALLLSDVRGVFNLCDEEAAPPQDVIAYAAHLMGITPPPEVAIEDADLSPMGASFYAECKRVSNARLKAATGWRPSYPTYREGLAAIFEADRGA
jgi:hypothetical protein